MSGRRGSPAGRCSCLDRVSLGRIYFGTASSPHTGHAANAVNDLIHKLLANGVVATSIYNALAPVHAPQRPLHDHTVVGSVLLAADQLFRVEKLAVGTGTDLVDGLQVSRY